MGDIDTLYHVTVTLNVTVTLTRHDGDRAILPGMNSTLTADIDKAVSLLNAVSRVLCPTAT